ncbi:TIM barrel protein [Candidatus Woesearchaeota archaeon]|nr:TIM barrel protein [Candidatus Woesearchaeota archaeon]
MDKLRFGTSGIPLSSSKKGTAAGIKKVRELNLDAMELEFVRAIYIKKDKTPEIKQVAEKEDIVLTCHAPYFINLNSEDKKKFYASIGYIKNSAAITSLCGGYSVCFHAGYYQKQNPKKVYDKIKEAVKIITKDVKEFDKKIWIRPETTGKIAQFGTIHEILDLSVEFDNVLPCIDWSHLHAWSNGKYNTKEEFTDVLTLMESKLGRKALDNVHFHCQGVEYSERGEKYHTNLKDSDLKYQELLKVWKDFKLKGVVIAESPNVEDDAQLMNKFYCK